MRPSVGTLVLFAALAISGTVRAQTNFREGFEGPDPSWQEGDADVRFQMERRRVQGNAHTGAGCEVLRFSAGNGTFLYVQHSVPPAALIDELEPRLWLRSNRQGAQLMARVVMPRAIDPKTNRPVTALVRGNQYLQAGEWQRLTIPNPRKTLERQLPLLQSEFGRGVILDIRGAYIDQIVLNVYGGAGLNQVQIDDLELTGRVAPPDSAIELVAGQQVLRPDVRLSGSVLLIDGKPRFIRAIRYQGESLTTLARMGFDAVLLDRPPSGTLLREANEADVWLLCPPPWQGNEDGKTHPVISASYDRVLCWHLGAQLGGKDLRRVGQDVHALRSVDRQSPRPLIGAPRENWQAYSRYFDILESGLQPLSSSIEMVDYGRWLRGRPRLARPGVPLWATIQTQLPPGLSNLPQPAAAQTDAISPWRAATPDQIRLMTYTALAAGVRGLVFDSQSRLDATDEGTMWRAKTVELLNLELTALAPLLATANYSATVSGSDSDVQVAVLATGSARLLLPVWSGPGGQVVPGQSAEEEISITVPGVPEANHAYQISPAGLRPLKHQRVAGGVRIWLHEFGLTSAVLLTQDPTVVSRLRRELGTIARPASQLARELAVSESLRVSQVARKLAAGQPPPPQANARFAAARASLEASDVAAARGDWEVAFLGAERSLQPLRRLQRVYWLDAVRWLDAPLSSPYRASFDLLPDHWNFATRVSQWPLGPDRLAGGDFEDLQHLVQTGWENVKYPIPGLTQQADLAVEAAHDGNYGLRLSAAAVDAEQAPELVEMPPVWITTPKVPIEAGWVRIHGWVKIPRPITGSIEGFVIYDSTAGSSLGLRIGQTRGWREFTMLRYVKQSGTLQVTFLLSGLGEVMLDDVTVQPVGPPQTVRR